MKVGDLVVHREYPRGPRGRVVAKTKKWGHVNPVFLVRWNGDHNQSRHIGSVLQRVTK